MIGQAEQVEWGPSSERRLWRLETGASMRARSAPCRRLDGQSRDMEGCRVIHSLPEQKDDKYASACQCSASRQSNLTF